MRKRRIRNETSHFSSSTHNCQQEINFTPASKAQWPRRPRPPAGVVLGTCGQFAPSTAAEALLGPDVVPRAGRKPRSRARSFACNKKVTSFNAGAQSVARAGAKFHWPPSELLEKRVRTTIAHLCLFFLKKGSSAEK